MKLRVEGIRKAFGQESVLKDIHFDAQEGKFLSILGDSGSGKSTILKIITGLVEPDDGRVFLDGEDITHKDPAQRGIAYVFQSPLLFPHLTVYENIAFGLEVKKVSKSELQKRVSELLSLLKIEELASRYPAQISGGQQQRVSIARALATKPSLILMDEPFSGLDPTLRMEMGTLIKSLQELLHLTIIFVTHDVNESLRLSDQIALIADGQILQTGDAKSVYYRPQNQIVASFMGGGNWIKGIIEQGVFSCDFGEFQAKNFLDGEASLFLRPHQIALNKNLKSDIVKIEEIRRLGKEIQVDVLREGVKLTIETFDDHRYDIGDEVGLEFPKIALHYVN
ncbi:ABC transporter ATP-binding protein [Petrocella sp. FN5]|uniref:ABC transporter ATP-binding protein n=1 Tax=Petrocella sp. FN5 TaxID=3032002 RepID=UPI0023DA0E6F|nr:ABC transporter ATP-binding protein [Petrocella sp. FN5]MDF1617607.1 ABC transporter ATP-binding protein [Petrocella sp. FN5]